MPDKSDLAGRIRDLRKKAGLSQEELAKRMGFSFMTVRRWEMGKHSPRVEEIQRLAAALHVTEAELLNGPEENKIRIEIILDRMDDTEEVIDMSGNKSVFSLFLSPDGAIGIKGGAKFASLEEIRKFLADAGAQLEEAFRFQQSRGAIPATA